VAASPPPIRDRHGFIDESLDAFRDAIGRDFTAYRGHVYRVFNFTRALAADVADRDDKSALAAVFHDLGIWSDRTVDYLAPSARRLRERLDAAGKQAWSAELTRMVELHHKLTPCRDEPLVEAFRRADLVDLSFGLIRFGIPRAYLREVQRTFPNAGFHLRVVQLVGGHALTHPLHPLPMLRL
jgi:hypothetical protein